MGGVKKLIALQKIGWKASFLWLSPREYGLFRSSFPEANKLMLPYFLKTRTRGALVMLLAAWHLEAVAEAIFWVKGRLRALKPARA